MSIIAMNTDNPLGRRPFQQMGDMGMHDSKIRAWLAGDLAGDFDFPGAPIPGRVAPEWLAGDMGMHDSKIRAWLAGNAIKESALHPPAIVEELASPWEALGSTMMLGAAAVTSTQTLVPTTDTTPVTVSAVASGQPVWSAWFSAQTLVPGLSNWEVVAGAIAVIALFKAFK
jgi:hypothetical protein